MKRRSREISVFSTSAIDLFASAMGAFIIIALILIVNKPESAPVPKEQPVPAAPPSVQPPLQEEGFKIEVPLGVVAEWEDQGVDIDLHVVHNSEHVYYEQAARPWGVLTKDEIKSVRDINREVFFAPRFDPEVSEGNYQVYLAYYGGEGGPGPYEVSGKLVVFPGKPGEASYPFSATVQQNHKGPPESAGGNPSPVALEFEVTLPPGASGAQDEDFQVRVR